MSPLLLFSFVVAYFLLLLVVAYRTSRGSDNESFFIGNRNSNWMLVAFGMIGTSLSGVTFVSVPGAVARDSFSYFQITLGYFLGYLLIAYVLLPLYRAKRTLHIQLCPISAQIAEYSVTVTIFTEIHVIAQCNV